MGGSISNIGMTTDCPEFVYRLFLTQDKTIESNLNYTKIVSSATFSNLYVHILCHITSVTESVIKINANRNREKKEKMHKILKSATGYLQTHLAMQWKYVLLSVVLKVSVNLIWSDKFYLH